MVKSEKAPCRLFSALFGSLPNVFADNRGKILPNDFQPQINRRLILGTNTNVCSLKVFALSIIGGSCKRFCRKCGIFCALKRGRRVGRKSAFPEKMPINYFRTIGAEKSVFGFLKRKIKDFSDSLFTALFIGFYHKNQFKQKTVYQSGRSPNYR